MTQNILKTKTNEGPTKFPVKMIVVLVHFLVKVPTLIRPQMRKNIAESFQEALIE